MIENNYTAPIFITGIERSGGSLIAGIIKAGGAYSGVTTNLMENVDLKKHVDNYYTKQALDPSGQFPLPGKRLMIPSTWSEDALSLLKKGGYDGSIPWMYKNCRIGQIWKLWHYAFPNAKWIIVRRRTGDIIKSCEKTGWMNAFQDEKIRTKIAVPSEEAGWLWWVRRQERNFVNMMNAGVNCKVIWPERIKYGDYQQVYETLKWVGLEWDDEIIKKSEALLQKYQELCQE